VGLGINL